MPISLKKKPYVGPHCVDLAFCRTRLMCARYQRVPRRIAKESYYAYQFVKETYVGPHCVDLAVGHTGCCGQMARDTWQETHGKESPMI